MLKDEILFTTAMLKTLARATIITQIYAVLTVILIISIFYIELFPDPAMLLYPEAVTFAILLAYHLYRLFRRPVESDGTSIPRRKLFFEVFFPIIIVSIFTMPAAIVNIFDFNYDRGEVFNIFKLLFPVILTIHAVDAGLKHRAFIFNDKTDGELR